MITISDSIKREAFHLSLAIEQLIYEYHDRVGMAAFVALAASFQNLVEHLEMGTTAQALFAEVVKLVTNPDFALEADDPAVRAYVFPEHETVQ